MNISFTKKQEEYISQQISSGDFQNASEVVRDALRMHLFYRERMLADLRADIKKGMESGISKRSVDDILQEKRAKYSS